MTPPTAQRRLLIVCNMPSDNTARLAEAVRKGATHPDIESVDVHLLPALEAGVDDVLMADGVIIGTTENFGSVSGLIKDFLERIYYPCLEHTQGKPYALYVRAGLDGQGTVTAVERIITGLRWRPVQAATVLKGEYTSDFEGRCEELGMTMAAGLDASIY